MLGRLWLLGLAPLLLASRPQDLRPFELADGERVAFIGNTFVERDLEHNHLETLLTTRFKDRSIVFRNLGWSGDTVFGHARASFGSTEDGFKHLARQAGELKPTTVFLAYGMNESFEGERGLAEFSKGLERLLDVLASVRARVVVLSPIRHEDLGRPLPDPADHNRSLLLYIGALKEAASRRKHLFIDLYALLGEKPGTDNGIHLNAEGYRRAAREIGKVLGLEPRPWKVEVDIGRSSIEAQGTRVRDLAAATTRVSFEATDEMLPGLAETGRTLYVRGLSPGRYVLKIGGSVAATGGSDEWARGIDFRKGGPFDRVEELRRAIAAKNLLYFNYWRPQNETYIFGFRKKEQGHLQPETPLFLPLIADKEAVIAKLRVPEPQPVTLEPEK